MVVTKTYVYSISKLWEKINPTGLRNVCIFNNQYNYRTNAMETCTKRVILQFQNSRNKLDTQVIKTYVYSI